MVKPLKLELKFPVDEFKRGLETIKTGLKKSKEHTKSMNIESKRLEGTLKKVGKAFGLIAGAATGAMGVLLATLPTLAPQFERIKLAFFRMGLDLGTKLAPAFDKIAESLEKFADSESFQLILDFIGKLADDFADFLGKNIENENFWKNLKEGTEGALVTFKGFYNVLKDIVALWDSDLKPMLKNLNKLLGGLGVGEGEGIGAEEIGKIGAIATLLYGLKKIGVGRGPIGELKRLAELGSKITGKGLEYAKGFPKTAPVLSFPAPLGFVKQYELPPGKTPEEVITGKTNNITIYNQIENLRGIDDLQKVEDAQNETMNNYLNLTGNSM